MTSPALLLLAATLTADFEGGSVARIEKTGPAHFRIGVKGETDQQGRNRQASWYYFRVDGAPRTELTFDMVDLPGEYNFKPNRGAITGDTPPVISYDRTTWSHAENVEYELNEARLRVRVRPAASTFWIAHTPPYTNVSLASLRKDAGRHRHFNERVLAKTPGGRDLLLWTITDPSRPAAGKKVVWLMFRQHAWESGTSWVGDSVVRTLLADDRLRERFIWKIFPMCDPDGVARGGVRFNGKGYDLNRNWDAVDARLTPEIAAEHAAIADWIRAGNRIDLFLSLHNTETSEYLEGAPGDIARTLGERFFTALAQRTSFEPSRPFFTASTTTTEGMKGRMTVVQGLWRDFQTPAFLMEQRIAKSPKRGRFPGIPDRLAFGRELPMAIAAALEQE
jgi:hypothetical protein